MHQDSKVHCHAYHIFLYTANKKSQSSPDQKWRNSLHYLLEGATHTVKDTATEKDGDVGPSLLTAYHWCKFQFEIFHVHVHLQQWNELREDNETRLCVHWAVMEI